MNSFRHKGARCEATNLNCFGRFILFLFLGSTLNCRPEQAKAFQTSTDWRNDQANLVVVEEINKAYAQIPFSHEYEGVLDKTPFELTWTTEPNLPMTWKGGVAGMVDDEIVLVGGLWMPGYKNLGYTYNVKTRVYREIPVALRLLNPGGVILLHDYFPDVKPLWSNGVVIRGPFAATERLKAEGARIEVLPLSELPWPTKLGSSVTSLALLVGAHAPPTCVR